MGLKGSSFRLPPHDISTSFTLSEWSDSQCQTSVRSRANDSTQLVANLQLEESGPLPWRCMSLIVYMCVGLELVIVPQKIWKSK
jgi:hypothetical protein